MWKYVKKLEYPINIQKKDLKMAKLLLAQYGGPNGEMSASTQYLNQRYTMPGVRGPQPVPEERHPSPPGCERH